MPTNEEIRKAQAARLARVQFPYASHDPVPQPNDGVVMALINGEFDDAGKPTAQTVQTAHEAAHSASESYSDWSERQWRRRVADLEDQLGVQTFAVETLLREFGTRAKRVLEDETCWGWENSELGGI